MDDEAWQIHGRADAFQDGIQVWTNPLFPAK
jgi:hypothetical protein